MVGCMPGGYERNVTARGAYGGGVSGVDVIWTADDLAASTQRVWLMASGLAAEIDDLRFQPEERVVPAPGLERLRQAADRAAAQAHELAERIRILTGDDGAPVAGALGELDRAVAEADRALRRLAQLGMGVSALTMGGDRIERLDRACVAVLRALERSPATMDDDDLRLEGSTRDEAVVELAGVICRLLVDRTPAIRATTSGAWARLAVDDQELHLISAAGDQRPQHRQWESPVMVSQPADAVLDVILGRDVTVGDIRLSSERGRVVLRDERDGADERHLWAYRAADGSLHIDGQDFGPRTVLVSDDGEYEWSTVVAAGDIPRLVEVLGGAAGEDVLEVLAGRYAGAASDQLDDVIRASGVPHQRFLG